MSKKKRIELIKKIEEERGTKLYVYVTFNKGVE